MGVETDARSRATSLVSELGSSPRIRRDDAPAEELFELLYPELRRLARAIMSTERDDHTLEPTALVHEAYFRLVDPVRAGPEGRTHFLAVGARVMRHLLIDHARRRGRLKRGGELHRVTLLDWRAPTPAGTLDSEELLSLDAALERLAEIDGRGASVVELRFFAGLTREEIARALGVSVRTVDGDWTHARAWLRRELAAEDLS
jgi:RNA polymerase sigma factor (TIGR02999 family)